MLYTKLLSTRFRISLSRIGICARLSVLVYVMSVSKV